MLIRIVLRLLGAFCIVFALIPFLFYGIFNTGVGALGLTGLALVSLPSLWNTRLQRFPRLKRWIVALGCVGLLFCGTVSGLIARRAWYSPPPDSGEIAVIVLGSKINGDRPSLMLQRRLNVAARYLETNPNAVCVVSGGQGSDEDYSEALVMYNYLVEIGTAPDRMLMEDKSSNTRQNLRYSRALLNGIDTAVIATDGFHQLRASVFATAEGLTTYNISSLTPWGLLPSYWAREILGVSWAFVTIQLGIA